MAAQQDGHLTTEQLSAFLDQELSADEQKECERHLETCQQCQQRLAALRQMVRLLHALPEPALPRSFALPTDVSYLQERSTRMEPAPAAQTRRIPDNKIIAITRTTLRSLCTLAAMVGFVLMLTGVFSALPHGGAASSTNTTSTGAAPSRSEPRAASPNTCGPNRGCATHQFASPTALATPTPILEPTPIPTDATGRPTYSEGLDLSTPGGHLELGTMLLIAGLLGFFLFRRKRPTEPVGPPEA